MNVAHMLIFGALALAFLSAIRRYRPALSDRVGFTYLVAASLAAFLAVLIEAAQVFGSRDANLGDVGRDLIGIMCFLLIYAGFDDRAANIWRKVPAGTRVCVIAIACIAVIVVVAPLTGWLWAYYNRASTFPVLLDFEVHSQTAFLIANEAEFSIIDTPAEWPENLTDHVGNLAMQQAEYPGITIQEPYPDWSEQSVLLLSVFLPGSIPQTLTLRIHDAEHDWTYADRFNRRVRLTPGNNEIRIPLSDVQAAPESREMNMRRISGIVIFSHNPAGPFDVYLDNLRLE